MIRFSMATVLIGFLASCSSLSESLSLTNFPTKFDLVMYDKGKKIAYKEINSDTESYKLIHVWLEANKDGWALDFIDYAPNVVLSSDDFKINITMDKKLIVINYKKENEWRQVSKESNALPDIGLKN